jgi:hypothetical protein
MARARKPSLGASEESVAIEDDAVIDDPSARLAAALGLTFRDPDLLRLALTHRSVTHDWAAAVPGV